MSTNISKETLLNEVSNPSIDAMGTRLKAEKTPDEEFNPFIDQISNLENDQLKWNISYFNRQLGVLRAADFSRKRLLHILDVKQYLQEIGVEGFDVENEDNFIETPEDTINMSYGSDSELEPASNNQSNIVGDDYLPNEQLAESVKDGSVLDTRVALEMALNNYRVSISELTEYKQYVQENLPETFDVHEVDSVSKDINQDKSLWNKDYFFLQKAYLNFNFSDTRFVHLIEVRQYLEDNHIELFKSKSVKTNTALNSSAVSDDISIKHSEDNLNRDNVRDKKDALHDSGHQSINQSDSKVSRTKVEGQNSQSISKLIPLVGGGLLLLLIFAWFLNK